MTDDAARPGPGGLTIRRATAADARVSARLSQEAFGGRLADPPADPSAPHKVTYLAELGGRVVGKAADRPLTSWYGGKPVPTCGIASVVVQPEMRGRGIAREVLRHVLGQAAKRAPLATLFPTAPGIYRGLGFGYVGAMTWVELATADLTGLAAPEVTLRRVERDDLGAVAEVYDAWAAQHDGPLRRSPDDHMIPDDLDAHRFTLAVDGGGRACGYAVWRRAGSLHDGSRLEVDDLVALDAASARALLASLGSLASAAPRVRILGAGEDLLPWLLPSARFAVVDRRPYHLAILDVAGAFEARGYGAGVAPSATASVRVSGLPLAEQDGAYRIEIAEGRARVDRLGDAVGQDLPRLSGQGLAMLYAGAPPADLRLCGAWTGPEGDLPALAAACGGRRFAIRDYF